MAQESSYHLIADTDKGPVQGLDFFDLLLTIKEVIF